MRSPSERRLFKRVHAYQRAQILDYIQEPSLERWRHVRDIPVSHGQTLYDVVDLLDICWPGDYPSSILVARVSKFIEKRDAECDFLEDAFR